MAVPIRREVLNVLTTTVRSMLQLQVTERVLFLTGEAGIGKSTLIRQLITQLGADEEPPIIAMTECSTPVAGTGVGFVEALKPFADVMASLVESCVDLPKKKSSSRGSGFKLDVGKFLVDTAPSWIGLIPVIGAPIFHALSIIGSGYDQVYLHNKLKADANTSATNQEQVFHQYINFLRKLAEQTPLVIVIDDFHWADTSSTNLLFACARELATAPVVFVVSYREHDVLGSGNHPEHPIVHVRNEIERYGLSRVINVPRADINDMRTLLNAVYPEYIPNPSLEAWLLRVTDGNLLFATQYMSTIEQEHYVAPRTAAILRDVSTMPAPSTATAVVAEYLRRLSREDKEQLRYLSAEGETISTQMASRLLEVPAVKIVQRLRALTEDHYILRLLGSQPLYASETTTFQFVHYLVHKALYDELAKEERVYLHGIACDILLEEMARAEAMHHNVHIVVARLAAHATVAGRHSVAAKALLKGAQWVWRSYSASEALHFIDECLAVVRSQVGTMPTVDVLSESRAGLQSEPLAGPHSEPLAGPHSESLTELHTIAIEALLLKAFIFRHIGRFTEADPVYLEAIAIANKYGTGGRRSEAYIGRAILRTFTGDHAGGEALARVALDIAIEAKHEVNRIHAMRVIGITYANRSMYDVAMQYDRQCLEAAIVIDNDSAKASALTNLGCVLDYKGDIDAALDHHEQSLVLYRKLQRVDGIITCLLNIGGTLNTLNDQVGAMKNFDEALALARSVGALREEAKTLNNMGIVRRRLGEYDESLRLVEQSIAVMQRIGDKEAVMHALPAVGDIYRDTQRPQLAIQYYQRSEELAVELGNPAAIAKARLFKGYTLLLDRRPAEALPLLIDARQQFCEIGAAHREIEAAISSATCGVLLEWTPEKGALETTAADILARVRASIPEHELDMELYARVWQESIDDFAKLGIKLT